MKVDVCNMLRMTATGDQSRADAAARPIYDIASNDPDGELIDRKGMSADEVAQISDLMNAIAGLREAEQRLSDVSRRYMQLGTTDMRALHYLILCQNRGIPATPSGIAQHLGISSASTTKLLDRLEHAGHLVRSPHPSDRRALIISITAETHRAAKDTVGRQQAKRFYAAARLTPDERDIVIRFLRDMTAEIALTGEEPWAQEGAHAPNGD